MTTQQPNADGQDTLFARRDDVIWAAGFFDGEGCVSIGRCTKASGVYFYLGISVYQNDRRPLDELLELFGGSLNSEKDAQKWRSSGHVASAALSEMLPYLRVKKEQAVTAIEFQGRRFAPGQNRPDGFSIAEDERDYLRCRQLKRGWFS